MIKLSVKRLSTVEGQAGIAASIGLESKLGNAVTFEASPSFKELWEIKLNEFPYSDHLLRILARQDLRLWESRHAVSEYLDRNMHKLRSLEALVDLVQNHAVNNAVRYNAVMGNVDEDVLHAMLPLSTGGALLHLMGNSVTMYRHYGDRRDVYLVPPTPRMVLSLMAKTDLGDHLTHKAACIATRVCLDNYPELFRGVIYHLNNQIRRFVSTGKESIPSVTNTFSDFMKPSPRQNEMAMVMWDPQDPELITHFMAKEVEGYPG